MMRCPACGHCEKSQIESISFETIWQSFEEGLKLSLKEEIKRRHTPAGFTSLFECDYCQVQYFYPAVPGNPDFYRVLSEASSVPYEKDRWEFTRVVGELPADGHVLDLGAGPGWFLEMARDRGCRVSAVDHNPRAATSLRERSIDTYASIDSYQEVQQERLDVVCAFHLIEHLDDVGGLFRKVRTLLKPGGFFYVSVPNRARTIKGPLEPLDLPPHHLTRWSTEALRFQAQLHTLDLDYIRFEPPDRVGSRSATRKSVYLRLRRIIPDRAAWVGARLAGRLMSRDPIFPIMVTNGRFARIGFYGHTMLARYRRPL